MHQFWYFTFWQIAAVFMVARLLTVKGCRLFFFIQLVELLEIPLLMMYPNLWVGMDMCNIALNAFSIVSTKCFPVARLLIFIHTIIKLIGYSGIDCDWQFSIDGLFWFRFWLNNLIILILIAYTFPRKEHYAKQSSRSSGAANATAASTASAR